MQNTFTTIRYHQRSHSLTHPNHKITLPPNTTIRKQSSLCLMTVQPPDTVRLELQQQQLLSSIAGIMQLNNMGKIQRIRVQQWCSKLIVKPSNIVWKKNINFYLKVLFEMLVQQKLMQPFVSVPNEGPLPNLTLYNIPFPIRQRLERKQSKQKHTNNNNTSIKSQSKQRQIVPSSNTMIKGHSNVQLQSYNQEQSKILYRKQVNKDYLCDNFMDNNSLSMNFINQASLTCQKRCKKKNSINVNSQNPKNYSFGKKNSSILKVQQRQQFFCDKENNPYILNNQEINRKLFRSKEKEVALPTMATEYTHNPHKDSLTLDLSQSRIPSNKNILVKIYNFLKEESQLYDQFEGKRILNKITDIAKQMGIHLSEDNELDSSILSQKSKAFRKASQNIKLKFVQTQLQTVQFMGFLQNVRNKHTK